MNEQGTDFITTKISGDKIYGVVHFKQPFGDAEFYIRIVFDTNTGRLDVGPYQNVLDARKTITDLINGYLSGAPIQHPTDQLPEGKWRIVAAVPGPAMGH